MLGLGVTKGSLAGSDVTQPQRNLLYESDFSSDTDGFDITVDGSVSAPTSIGGEDDAMKITLGQFGSSGQYAAAFNNSSITEDVPNATDVTFDFRYYVPSSNTGADSIIPIFDNVSGTAALDVTLDSWNTYSDIITTASGTVTEVPQFKITAGSSGSASAAGDVVYIKDVEIYYYS